MTIHIFSTKERAKAFCKDKNKRAKHKWSYMKGEHGGYLAYQAKGRKISRISYT